MAHLGSRNGLNPKDWWDFYVDNEIRVVAMPEVVERGLEACAREVFERVVDGRLNKQIADDLGTSIRTVKAHRANVMTKMAVRSLAELVGIANRLARSSPM